MNNIKIELNQNEVGQLLKGPEIRADITRRCAAIANTATNTSNIDGAEFGHDVVAGTRRAHGMVWTDNVEAMVAEATDRTLTRSIDAGEADMSVITFPDTVAVVITRLRAALPGLTFCHDVPNPRPDTFIRILRTGGPRSNLVVDGAQITIESWSPDGDTAAANATLVRAQLNHLPEVPTASNTVCLVEEMSGPQELPDPLSASRRFTWTAVVHIRAN